MNAWKLNKEDVYILQEDSVVGDLMKQLRVPDLFSGAGTDQQPAFVAFDNHPTHWIILQLFQGLPDYSPNHVVNRSVRHADPNGLLFTALPKSSTSRAQIERKLTALGPGSEVLFSQFPQE